MLDDARTRELARNLLRSGTAAHADYVSAQRGRSHDEFTARLGHACEDIAEAKGWLDVLLGMRAWLESGEVEALQTEAEELTRILECAYRTAQGIAAAADEDSPDDGPIASIDKPIER